MNSLDSSYYKVKRAKAEIEQLSLKQDEFFQNTHYSIVPSEKKPETGKIIYRVKIEGSPPSLDWGVDIGEIAHNLRCALNYLVYQLALLNNSSKPETVAQNRKLQFPIFSDPDQFKKSGKAMLKLLKIEHQISIEQLQPFNKNGDSTALQPRDLTKWGGYNAPLLWLEEINNADKHRLIQVAGVKPSSFGVTYWGERDIAPFSKGNLGILEDGVIFCEADPDVSVNPEIHPILAFASGCDTVYNLGVILLLQNIEIRVTEIIDIFSSEFK